MPKPDSFPFIPHMEDCRKIVRAEGCICYIMDVRCRDMTAEDKAAADKRILQVLENYGMKRESPD